MIMIILEYMCVDIARWWYIDFTIEKKKTSQVCKLKVICVIIQDSELSQEMNLI